jgi:hypothetical protein
MTKTLIVHLGIGKAGNKLSIDAAILLNEAGYSIHAKTYPAPSFKSDALAEWAKKHLATGCAHHTNTLAVIDSGLAAGRSHKAAGRNGCHPNEPSECHFVNIPVNDPKSNLNCTLHAFNYDRYVRPYLRGINLRFNRSLDIATMTAQITNPAYFFKACAGLALSVDRAHGQ